MTDTAQEKATPTTASANWTGNDYRMRRIDGAVVTFDESSPHPNPMNPRSRMYTAFEPDPSEKALLMHRRRLRTAQDGQKFRFGFPRRWKTAEAAMKAVDREYPIVELRRSNLFRRITDDKR